MENDNFYYSNFIFTLLITFALSLSGIVAINWLVDPFDIFQHQNRLFEREEKPEVITHMRMTKAFDIITKKPKVLLLGSSRVLQGINTDDLNQYCQSPSYNCGLIGANFQEIYAYFEHALYNQPELKTIVLGIDLFAFNAKRECRQDFLQQRLCKDVYHFEDRRNSLITFEAVKSTLKTIFKKEGKGALDENGNFPAQYLQKALKKKKNNFFEQERDVLLKHFSRDDTYATFELSSEAIILFQRMVEKCQKNQIDLKVFICPARSVYWSGLYQAERWEFLNELKLKLVQNCDLFDFSGINEISALPFEEDERFFDSIHFHPIIGKEILSIIFEKENKINFLVTKETILKRNDLSTAILKEWMEKFAEASAISKSLI